MSLEAPGFLWKFLLGAVVLLMVYLRKRRSNKRYPPGPIGLPLIGNGLQLGNRPHLTFIRWAEKYGPIFKIKIGLENIIIIHEPKLVKELFSENVASGRWVSNPIMTEFSSGPNGVINSEGEVWETQRRFILRTLRDFGYLKSTMHDLILDEVQTMVKWLKMSNEQPILGNNIFTTPVVNSLWSLVSGERCKWEDSTPPIMEVFDEFSKITRVVSSNGLLFAPFMRHIAPDLFSWTKYHEYTDMMKALLLETVVKHEKELDPSKPKDLIDHYLIQIRSTMDENSSFYKDVGYRNLNAVLFDLLLGGSETSSHTLSWSLLYLSHHPNVQMKLISEIHEVIGTSRLPSLADKQNMPYTEAVILETMRMSALVSLGNMHRIREPMTFHGYTLERDDIVLANLYGIHHDKNIWGDPETFRPERFLREEADGSVKVIRHESLIPFLEGKRKCMGEGFARDTLFLFTTGIFQNFQVLPDPESKGGPDFEPELGFVLVPKPFRIVMSPRIG